MRLSLRGDRHLHRPLAGLPSDQPGPVFEDREGAIWVGSYGAGPARIAGGAIAVYAAKEGLGGLTVLSLHEDDAGVLWFGTSDGGLHRLKNGKVAAVTSREGLHDDGVFQILEAGGSFWLSSNGGVFRVARDDLEAVLSGQSPRLTKTSVFGAADGMPSRQCSGGSVPNAWKGPDGRLWFATTKGVAVIDPARIPQNTMPPPVVIEEAIASGRVFPRGVPVDVPPGDGRLEIRYAALSFLGTDRVLFRYRLEGFEEAVTEAGTRRTAYYTNVPPGRYTFRVSACNADGVWNETGATLGVVLAPRVYQRRGFLALLVALAAALAFVFHRIRVAELVSRGRELDAKVVEKTQGLVVEKERAESARRESDSLRTEAEARREELARKNRELHRANLSLERANQKLRELSYLDEPTGLASLRHFEESLEEEWRRGLRAGTPLGLLVLSLPGLAGLVARDGKDAGEALEVAVGHVLLAALKRAGDLAARLAEGTFAVLVPGATSEDTLAVREDLRARLSALALPDGGVAIGTASAVPTREGSATALFDSAREAGRRIGP